MTPRIRLTESENEEYESKLNAALDVCYSDAEHVIDVAETFLRLHGK